MPNECHGQLRPWYHQEPGDCPWCWDGSVTTVAELGAIHQRRGTLQRLKADMYARVKRYRAGTFIRGDDITFTWTWDR